MIGRRGFITGLVAFVAAPAIVRAGSLMPVKSVSLRSIITPSEMGIDLPYAVGQVVRYQGFDWIFSGSTVHAFTPGSIPSPWTSR